MINDNDWDDDEEEDVEEEEPKTGIRIPKFLIPPALPKIEASGSDSPKEVRGIDMITGVPESEKEETSDEMMADAMGIPPGEGGMQEAFEDVTGMPADSDGDGEDDDMAINKITGMDEGAWEKISGMGEKSRKQITGLGPGEMAKVTGMGEDAWKQITGIDPKAPTSDPVDLDDITGMGEGAWEEITGEPAPKKSRSKIVSRSKKRSKSGRDMMDDITGMHAGYMEDIG